MLITQSMLKLLKSLLPTGSRENFCNTQNTQPKEHDFTIEITAKKMRIRRSPKNITHIAMSVAMNSNIQGGHIQILLDKHVDHTKHAQTTEEFIANRIKGKLL